MAKNMVRFDAPLFGDVEVSRTKRGAISFVLAALLIISPLVAMPSKAQAATLSQGPQTSDSETSLLVDLGGGAGLVAWTDMNGVRSAGGSRASASLSPIFDTSQNLVMTDFGFSIPAGATIDGIEVSVEHRQNGGAFGSVLNLQDHVVKIGTSASGSAVLSSDNKARSEKWDNSDEVVTYGSSSDDWGTTWTPEDINHSTFGVVLSVKSDAAIVTRNAQIDHVTVTVTYTEAVPVDTTAPELSDPLITTPTNDDTPTFTFTTDEDGTIAYGGSCSSSTNSAFIGANPVELSSLADGTYNDCFVTVTDASSNVSDPLAIPAFTIDTEEPTITFLLGGSNPTNQMTMEVTVQFSEDVIDFDETDIVTAGAGLGSFNEVSPSVYTFELTGMAEGPNIADIAQGVTTDAAGNGNASAQLNVERDTTGPGVTINSPVNASYITTENVIANFDVSGATSFECDIDGDGFGPCESLTSHTLTGLDDGEHTFSIEAEDALLNQTTASVTFTVDTEAPEVTDITTPNDPTNAATIPVTVTFSEDVFDFEASDLTIVGGDADAFAGSGDTYTFNIINPVEGEITVDIDVNSFEDVAGNDNDAAADQFTVEYDVTPPMLDITDGPTNGTIVQPSEAVFLFTSDATGLECNVDGSGFASCDSDTSHDLSGLPDGVHTFELMATDEAGNTTNSSEISFTIDGTAPALSEVTPVPTPTEATNPSYTFSSSEAGDLAIEGSCDTSATDAVSGGNVITLTGLALGVHSDCSISVTDEAGNETALSITTFEIVAPHDGNTSHSGGGGGNDDEDTTPANDEEEGNPVDDIGGFIENLFGGGNANPGENDLAGGPADEGGDAGDGEAAPEGAGDELATPGNNLNSLLANVFGAGENAWWLLLLALILAGGGYGGWMAYKKYVNQGGPTA